MSFIAKKFCDNIASKFSAISKARIGKFQSNKQKILHLNVISNASNLVELQVHSQAWVGTSSHLGKQIVGHSQNDETIRHTSPSQCHNNWDHTKVLTFIPCKHVEHTTRKELINPR
jgi:hypothetical protein